MASNALECDVCCNVFSEHNCPRILNCTHTFCGPCIDGIIATQKKTCPTCRAEFTATSAEDLVINRGLLDVVRQLSSMNLKPKTLSKGPTGSFAELPKEFQKKLTKESIQEKKTRVSWELKFLEKMKDVFSATETLNEMKDGLLGTKKEVGRFKEMLSDIELSIEEILSNINESGDHLDAATDLTLTEPYDAQEKVRKIKDLLQKNQRERDDITKEILQMKRRLKIVAEDVEKTFGMDPAVEEAKEMEEVEEMKEKKCAVKTIGGKLMVAPVRVKPRNQVRLSHFAEGDVPPKPLFVEHEALMRTSPRKAFLDLAVGGTLLSRIVIRVRDEGNLALNFLHVCAGDLGPSYADSQLSSVDDKGRAGERIHVCTHSKSVIEVNWKEERRREIYKSTPWKAGEVRGYLSDERASEFFIVTRDDPEIRFFQLYNTFIGIVEEGLDALRDAISQYPDIKAVKIVDCGLMFPL